MRRPKTIFWLLLPSLLFAACTSLSTHRLVLDAYFQNVAGLREKAHVAVDGITLGVVDRITVRPERGDHPVQVSMTIRTEKPLSIPADAVATLETEGVLGPTFVDIDTRQAAGPPVKNGGTLKTVEFGVTGGQAAQAIEKVGTEIVEELKKPESKSGSVGTASVKK